MKIVCRILSFAIIIIAFPLLIFAEDKGMIKIVAIIHNNNGTPATGTVLNVYKVKENKFEINLDGQGTLTNPMGECDAKGQLTIQIPRDYLKPGEEFTLARILQLELKDEKGNYVTFKYPEKFANDTINLGSITLKN